MKNYLMLACTIIQDEVRAAPDKGNFPILFIPPDLHLIPDKLREYLQDLIDRIDNVDAILMPMGRCGNGTIGLHSKTAAIILPRCGDCIDLMLSKENLSAERPTHTYFLTAGWLREKNAINREYEATVEKYGREKADMVMGMIYANYRSFGFINTGTYDLAPAREKIRPLAESVGVEISEMEGKCSVLHKMMRLEFDDNFVIVPPGEIVGEAHFR